MRVRLYLGLSVAVLAGCAHPQLAPAPAPTAAGCQGYRIDHRWLQRGPVYQPCDVDEAATATYRTPTGYRPLECKQASATVVLVVDATGRPEPRTVTVVHSTARAFSKAVVKAIRQWRYRPAVRHGLKVRQVTQQRFEFQCQQVPQRRAPA